MTAFKLWIPSIVAVCDTCQQEVREHHDYLLDTTTDKTFCSKECLIQDVRTFPEEYMDDIESARITIQ